MSSIKRFVLDPNYFPLFERESDTGPMRTAGTGAEEWSTRTATLVLSVKLGVLKSGVCVARSPGKGVVEDGTFLDVAITRVWGYFISEHSHGQPCVACLALDNYLPLSSRQVKYITNLETICCLGRRFGLEFDRSVTPDPKTVEKVEALARRIYGSEDAEMTAVPLVAPELASQPLSIPSIAPEIVPSSVLDPEKSISSVVLDPPCWSRFRIEFECPAATKPMKTAETGEKAWSTRMFTLGLPVKLVLLKSGEYVVRSLDQEVLEGEECLDVTLMRVWAQFISAEQNGQPCVVRLSRENCLLRSPKDVEDITDLETICSLGDQFGLKLDRSVAPDPKTVATVAELVRQSYSLEDPVMTAVQTVASQSLDVQESEKR